MLTNTIAKEFSVLDSEPDGIKKKAAARKRAGKVID
jgi:hypothetical protein